MDWKTQSLLRWKNVVPSSSKILVVCFVCVCISFIWNIMKKLKGNNVIKFIIFFRFIVSDSLFIFSDLMFLCLLVFFCFSFFITRESLYSCFVSIISITTVYVGIVSTLFLVILQTHDKYYEVYTLVNYSWLSFYRLIRLPVNLVLAVTVLV